jgi:hypothetical protein
MYHSQQIIQQREAVNQQTRPLLSHRHDRVRSGRLLPPPILINPSQFERLARGRLPQDLQGAYFPADDVPWIPLPATNGFWFLAVDVQIPAQHNILQMDHTHQGAKIKCILVPFQSEMRLL